MASQSGPPGDSLDLVATDSANQAQQIEALAPLEGQLAEEMEKLDKMFWLDTQTLKKISEKFQQELEEGLEDHDRNISMYITWVLGFPSGKEKGSFLTVDLGGTNLRVCWITLKGKGQELDMMQDQFKLPEDLKTGHADQLWEFIAEAIGRFIKDKNLGGSEDDPLSLGFTFSYPAIQGYIDHGVLRSWTKGFDIDGVEGEDAAGQLRNKLSQKNLPVKLVALVNDTTGAMIASAYNDPETFIGAIFGTGCNAAYMENVGSIPKLKQGGLSKDTLMAINCEYGAFDNSHSVIPRTRYDDIVDKESPRPGEQTFEKTSAGLYLGEIFRLVLLDLSEKGLIFKGQNIEKLKKPYSIDTSFLSAIEDDASSKLSDTQSTYKDNLDITVTEPELELSRRLAELVAMRGARLCTTGVAAICRKKNIVKGHVAADGSVANKHPKFKKRWGTALGEILDWPEDRTEDPIILTSAEDGSGFGAAVIAAMTIERARKGQTAGIKEQD